MIGSDVVRRGWGHFARNPIVHKGEVYSLYVLTNGTNHVFKLEKLCEPHNDKIASIELKIDDWWNDSRSESMQMIPCGDEYLSILHINDTCVCLRVNIDLKQISVHEIIPCTYYIYRVIYDVCTSRIYYLMYANSTLYVLFGDEEYRLNFIFNIAEINNVAIYNGIIHIETVHNQVPVSFDIMTGEQIYVFENIRDLTNLQQICMDGHFISGMSVVDNVAEEVIIVDMRTYDVYVIATMIDRAGSYSPWTTMSAAVQN